MSTYQIRYKPFKGWEPQQKYTMGMLDGTRWFPLNEQGYWLEPEAFNYGKITKHNYFTRKIAKNIIHRASFINQENIEVVK